MKHPLGGTVPQQGGNRVPSGFATSWVVSRREVRVLSRGKLLRLCSIDPLQAAPPHEVIDEGTSLHEACPEFAGTAFSDQKRIVMPNALPASRASEQRLVREPLGEPFDELLDRLGLIARGGVISFELEGLLFHADGFPMAGPGTIS